MNSRDKQNRASEINWHLTAAKNELQKLFRLVARYPQAVGEETNKENRQLLAKSFAVAELVTESGTFKCRKCALTRSKAELASWGGINVCASCAGRMTAAQHLFEIRSAGL